MAEGKKTPAKSAPAKSAAKTNVSDRAAKQVERLTKEVREQQVDTQTDNLLTNVPSQGDHEEALGQSVKGGKEKELVVDRVGEDTIVSIGSQSVRFVGAEGRAALTRKFR